MNPEMNLLYLKSTGHVLAAFTRSGEPDKAETTAASFVGDGLHLRGFDDPSKYAPPHTIVDFNHQDFLIPSAEIGVFRTTLDGSVIRFPFLSTLINLDKTPTLATISKTKPDTHAFLSSSAPAVKITLAESVQESTDVLLLLETSGPAPPTVKLFSIDPPIPSAASQDVALPLSNLAIGRYYPLIFIKGYPACVAPFEVI